MKLDKNYNNLYITLAVVGIAFLSCSLLWLYPDKGVGPNMMTAFLGVFLSALVTLLLLRGQTKAEETKDRNARMFNEKLKVYSLFNQLLWKETDRLEIKKLRENCMQKLCFYLSKEQISDLTQHMKQMVEAYNEDKTKGMQDSRSKITALLKSDLNEAVIDGDEISELYKSMTLPQRESKDDTVPVTPVATPAVAPAEPEAATQGTQASNAAETTETITPQRPVTYWHLAALEPPKQDEALQREDPFISLIEYGESWRSERLMQIKPGDIIFLFYRGGPGYVGMYRARRTEVMQTLEGGQVKIFKDGKESPSRKLDADLEKLDIYDAIGDGADYVANAFVEEIVTKSREESGNPIGTIRQTIARVNPDNARALLEYFGQGH